MALLRNESVGQLRFGDKVKEGRQWIYCTGQWILKIKLPGRIHVSREGVGAEGWCDRKGSR